MLREFLIEIIEKCDESSNKVYEKIGPLLQEQSHSFGFKFFADLSLFIIEEIERINDDKELSYLYFEKNIRDKKQLSSIMGDFEKDYLKLIFTIVEKIQKEDLILGKLFSLFLVDEQENIGDHSFLYTDNLLKFIEEKLDLEIYKNTELGFEEYGVFYYIFFNNLFDRFEEVYELILKKQISTFR